MKGEGTKENLIVIDCFETSGQPQKEGFYVRKEVTPPENLVHQYSLRDVMSKRSITPIAIFVKSN